MAMPVAGTKLGPTLHLNLHNIHQNVKAFGAVGNGTTDDTVAINAAIAAAATGGTVFFPPGNYKVTSTIDLSAVTNLHLLGGHTGSGSALGAYPPNANIDGTTISTGAVFFANRGGDTANHTFENLSIYGGRTGVRYFDAANIWFRNCSMYTALNDGHADNCALLIENCEWIWVDGRGGYSAPVGATDKPAMILRGRAGFVNIPGPGIVQVHGVTFWGGGVEYQQNVDSALNGTFAFVECIVENTTHPFLKIVQGAAITQTWHVNNLYMRHCFLADSGGSPPLVELDGTWLDLDDAIIEQCGTGTGVAIKATHINVVAGVKCVGMSDLSGSLSARLVTDGSGNYLGSSIADKRVGFDIIANQYDATNNTNNDLAVDVGPAIRMARNNDTRARFGLDHAGTHSWGSGSADFDTNLYRSAADTLKTDDKFLANVAGLGTKHEGAATPTGGTSGEIRVGNGKIWVNDAGTWKSVTVA